MVKIKQVKIEDMGNNCSNYYYDITDNDIKIGNIVLSDNGFFNPVGIEDFYIYEEFRTRDRAIYALEYVLFVTRFFKNKTLRFELDMYSKKRDAYLIEAMALAGARKMALSQKVNAYIMYN